MSITRRRFLRAGSLVALWAAIPAKGIFGQEIRQKQIDGNPQDRSQSVTRDQLANYNKAAFESYLNSVFRLYTGASLVEITLVEVKDIGAATAKRQPGTESFSLLFRGGTREIDQGTYQLEHPSLGPFRLFLVPGAPDDNGAASYVAIINRIPYDSRTPPSGTTRPVKKEAPKATPPKAPEPIESSPPQTDAPARTKPEQSAPRRRKPQSSRLDN